MGVVMYHRGSLQEFTAWHDAAKITENIPAEGRIGYVNGILAPQNERTYIYATVIQNPDLSDDYIWPYGDHPIDGKNVISYDDFINLGWV